MLANDMEAECRRLRKCNPNISCQIYDTGGHPLILSQAEKIAAQIKEFLLEDLNRC